MAMNWTLDGRELEEADILGDLVRETFLSLLPVTLALGWLWLASAIIRSDDRLGPAYLVLGLLIITTALGYGLAGRHVHLATTIYLGTLLVVVTVAATAYSGGSTLHLYLLVVIVAGMLVGPRTLGLVAVASVGLVLAVGFYDAIAFADLLGPIVVISLTGLMTWLSSRRLFTALAWALTMTRESQKNLREARERRAEVLRILKSLDEAYVRLEWANRALIFAREAAQKAYRFKSEFVANVSHELRTPLNLIVGFSEMMATAPESYQGATLPSAYRGDVMAIYRSARHLSDLIDDVLDLSKIEAGRLPLHREPTDLGAIIREAVEMVRGLAEPKGLRLDVALPLEAQVLYLDRTRIRQVLLNLLTNAVRFTDAGGIRVRVEPAVTLTSVAVEDSGRGIAPERLAQAFESFSQLQDDQAREGNGLGLALSKRFVELHGGTMGIESTPGRGTTVSFTLPRNLAEAGLNGLSVPSRLTERGEQPQIAVLHDDPRILPVLQRYLEGYCFALTPTPDEALTLVRESAPAAVVLDAEWTERRVPLVALAELRARVPLLTCPLPSLRRLGLLLGSADYLVKPISRDDLLAALGRLNRAPRSVLLVDDDPGFVRLLSRVLTATDPSLRILEASGAREGLEIVRAQRPDLVLLDLLMPGTSGYDVLAEIRRDEALAPVDVIVMSARDLDEEAPAADGEIQLSCPSGFSLGQLAQCLQALLDVVTAPGSVARDGAGAPRADRPVVPA
jgi:signal transduction histidine kinase/CheY-like chemotaxis protein